MIHKPHPNSRSPEDASVLFIDPNATKGLFVGDLSSFTTENDLHQLFGSFGPISSVEIKRGRHGDSLLHGFVEYTSEAAAFSAIQVMHNRKFKGRKMRVNWTNMKVSQTKNVDQWTLVQVHFSCNNISMMITEEFLEAVFGAYGSIEDVIVKRHIVDTNPPMLHGYGNIYFLDTIRAMNAIVAMKDITVNGVSFGCSLTMPKSASFAASSAAPVSSGQNFGENRAKTQSNSPMHMPLPVKHYTNAILYYGTGSSRRARIQSIDSTFVNPNHRPCASNFNSTQQHHTEYLDTNQNRIFSRTSTNFVQPASQFPNKLNHIASKPSHLNMSLSHRDNFPVDHPGKRPPLPPSHFIAASTGDDCWSNSINNPISKSSSNSPSNCRFLSGYGSSNGSVNSVTTHDHLSINSSVSKSLSRSHSGEDGSFDAIPFLHSHGGYIFSGLNESVRKHAPASSIFSLPLGSVSNDSMNFLYQPQAQSFPSRDQINNTKNSQQFDQQCFSGLDRHLFDLSPSPEPFPFDC